MVDGRMGSGLEESILQLKRCVDSLSSGRESQRVYSGLIDSAYHIIRYFSHQVDQQALCPLGYIAGLTYLSVAHEPEWRAYLLHKATHILYSSPGLGLGLDRSGWLLSDSVIRTLLLNSMLREMSVVDIPLSGENSLLLYAFYIDDLCECTSRSWCLPFWFAHAHPLWDVLLVPESYSARRVYAYNHSAASHCFEPTGIALSTHVISTHFTTTFIFGINSFMEPSSRVIRANRTLLYPAFDLSSEQIGNFRYLGTEVIPDDSIMKPPNPSFRELLEAAALPRDKRSRTLVYLARVRPGKGQLEFLQSVESADTLPFVISMVGPCDGDLDHCDRVNTELNRLAPMVEWTRGPGDDAAIAKILGAAAGLLLASTVDCNPRVVYEALWAGTPFVVTKATRIAHDIHHLGRILEADLIGGLHDFNHDSMIARWRETEQLDFAKQFVTDDQVYANLSNRITSHTQ